MYADSGEERESVESLEEMTESQRYESLCREAWPIVSVVMYSTNHVETIRESFTLVSD